MAKRSGPPTRAQLSLDEKRRSVRRFEALIERFEKFDPETIAGRDDPKVTEIAAAAKNALEKTYPPGTTQNDQLSRLRAIEYAMPAYIGRPTPVPEVREALRRTKADCVVLLRQAIADLREDIDIEEQEAAPPQANIQHSEAVRAAFIVHGHDEGPREAVARFLERLRIKPIILHEQANKGRTLIEKFEQHGGVPFAVVLLTPDDVDGMDPGALKPRARQNVILELGYFIGSLGRAQVCALKKGNVEEPSDFVGVAYIDYDDGGAWQQKLAKEIEAAGIDVDWNKVMK